MDFDPGTKSILVRYYNIYWVAVLNAGTPNSMVNELDTALC